MIESPEQKIARLEARCAELERLVAIRTAQRDFAAGVIARELDLLEGFEPAPDLDEEHDHA